MPTAMYLSSWSAKQTAWRVMDSIDNFESWNAREWEEPAELSQVSTPTPKPNAVSRVGKLHQLQAGSNTTSTSSTKNPCASTEPPPSSHRIANPGTTSPIPTSITNGLQDSAPHPQAHIQRYELKYSKEGKRGKFRRFPKTSAIPSMRKIDEIEKVEESTQEIDYVGKPPHSDLRATGYYFWSDKDCSPSDLLGLNLKLLDEVRKQCHVYIDLADHLGCIRLRAENEANILDGLDGVKSKVRQTKVAASGLRPLYIVKPPTIEAMTSTVSPKFASSTRTVKQPVVEKILLAGPRLTEDESICWEDRRRAILRSNEKLFKEHVEKNFAELGELISGQRMRVHFGHMHLSLYRKNFNTGYLFEDFLKMMSETRTKAYLEKSVGESYVSKVKERVQAASDLFCPADPWISELQDVKPKHSIVIWARSSSHSQIRIEADMDMADDGSNSGDTWQIGTTNFYGLSAGKARLSVGVFDLESKLDWCLEVVTNDKLKAVPQAFRQLVIKSLPGKPLEGTYLTGLSCPSITLQVPSSVTVDNTWVKSITRYRLRDTSYILEASVYCRWDGADTRGSPSVLCGVSLYNKEWEVIMGSGGEVIEDREWNVGLTELFPSGTGLDNGFSDFLSKVETVQSFLERV